MRADIFTEGSSTLREDPGTNKVRDYFAGGFMSVTSFADRLSEHAETEIHVISEELGYVKGSDEVEAASGESLSMEEFVGAKNEYRDKMQERARNSDVIVLLFTKDSFRTLVATQWSKLVEAARPDTIWCIATSGKAFDTVDLDALRRKGVDLIRYERVGVARIGNEVREELIEKIDGRS